MRLWHKDLISVLPRQQLIGQWRECCAIAKAIAEDGTPNHILVNKIIDYPIEHFIYYAKLVRDRLIEIGYKCYGWSFEKHLKNKCFTIMMEEKDIFKDWHNNRYLKQCYYNLQEKFDCGGVSEEDWIKIKNKFEEKLNK